MILALLLLISNSFATDLSNIIWEINDLNRMDIGSVQQANCEGPSKSPVDKAYRCALDICGAPQDLPNLDINDSTYDQYLSHLDFAPFKELEPKIKEMVQYAVKDNNTLVKEFKKRLAESGGKLQAVDLDSLAISQILEAQFGVVFFPQIDHSKPIGDRVSFFEDEITLTEEQKSAYESLKKDVDNEYENHVPYAIMNGVYTLDESHDLLVKQLKDLKLRVDKASKNGAFKGDPEFLKTIEQYISDNQLDPSVKDLNQFIQLAYTIESYNSNLTFYESGTFPKNEFDYCKQVECRSYLNKVVDQTDWGKLADTLKSKVNDPKVLPTLLNNCKSQVASKNLIDYDQNKLLDSFNQIKESFVANGLKGFSADSKQEVISYFENDIGFNTAPEGYKNFKEYFESEYQSYKDYASFDKSYESYSLGTLMSEITTRGENQLMNFNSCDYGASIVWDSYMKAEWNPESDKDQLNISMFSNLFLGYGKNILAHELGHALSFNSERLSVNSSKHYDGLRTCVQSKHNAGGGSYLEEDMADFISFRTGASDIIMSCALLDRNSDNTKYENISIINHEPRDPHSSAFLRTINEALFKKFPLSKACSELIEESKDKYRFNKCLE